MASVNHHNRKNRLPISQETAGICGEMKKTTFEEQQILDDFFDTRTPFDPPIRRKSDELTGMKVVGKICMFYLGLVLFLLVPAVILLKYEGIILVALLLTHFILICFGMNAVEQNANSQGRELAKEQEEALNAEKKKQVMIRNYGEYKVLFDGFGEELCSDTDMDEFLRKCALCGLKPLVPETTEE
ncbi:MAG: hypothetical protein ACJA16_003266 [Akkermansiaceae bacterium]|jgi:hypothetical protein